MLKRTKPIFLISLPFLLAAEASRADWHCSNDVEVQCSERTCTANNKGDFTPMDVSFSSTGEFSVCAYSGCWEGMGQMLSTAPYLVIWKPQAHWSNPGESNENREDVIFALSLSDQIAVLKVGGFAQPLHCSKD